MDAKLNRRLPQQATRTRHAAEAIAAVADARAPGVEAATNKGETGLTAASTHTEHDHRANDGRPASWIVQEGVGRAAGEGAPVPEEFRQHRDQMVRGFGN